MAPSPYRYQMLVDGRNLDLNTLALGGLPLAQFLQQRCKSRALDVPMVNVVV